MTTIKIEFPESNKEFAAALGCALLSYSGDTQVPEARTPVAEPTPTHEGTDVELTDEELAALTSAEASAQGGVAAPDATLGDVSATGELQAEAPPLVVGVDIDEHGVRFDAEYCAKAKDPFYGEGAKAGQWKKGRGVDEAAYDAWYGGARIDAVQSGTALAPGVDDEPVDATAAFAASAPAAGVPTDMGALMMYISEQQTAGHLTAEQIENAYATTGISVPDLCVDDPALVAANCAKVYEALQA